MLRSREPARVYLGAAACLERGPLATAPIWGGDALNKFTETGAARALGDETVARDFYEDFLDVAHGGMRQPALQEAQDFVAQ